jgi:orotate phosphoribosyltransferase
MPQIDHLHQGLQAGRGSERVASILVETGAVSFQTSPFFKFTSGVESPVYVDNRRLLGFVQERREIVRLLGDLAGEACGERIAAIAGTATAGIPWGAWLSEALHLPMMYARSEAKAWGHRKAVEGCASPGAQTLVVEDLAFTGGSIVAAVENLRSAGYRVDDCLTIVTYGMPRAVERFAEVEVCHRSLTTIDLALTAAVEMGVIATGEADTVHRWLEAQRGAQASHIRGKTAW